jgi:hypothetical protein
MRRVLVVVVAALAVLGACARDDRFLPVGDYAGSTSSEQSFRISIGNEPKVNGVKAEWDEAGAINAKGLPLIKCKTLDDGEELLCRMGDETIELMKE